MHRPTVLPTPLLPLKAVYGGELVEHLLVNGQRVLPARARAERVRVRVPRLDDALRVGVGGTGCGVTFAAAGSAVG